MLYLVSILIPVYNADKYLAKTLDSVLAQTWRNLEIILINDGSTDTSINILEEYKEKDSRIKVYSQKNRGQCAAFNYAFEKSNGDYIKFFDADDLMNAEHIELQLKTLNGKKNYIASCEWGRFFGNNSMHAKFITEPVWKDMKPIEWLVEALSQKADMMGAWLWLIPRTIIEKAGLWNERLSLNNDFDFSIRVILSCSGVKFAKGAKVFYRSGLDGNLAATNSKTAYQAALLSTDLGCKSLLAYENSPRIRQICANRYKMWAYRIYPHYKKLVDYTEKKENEFGGSNIKMDGGKSFKVIQSIFGWKIAKRIKLFWTRIKA